MANNFPTPNVQQEQANKQWVRANSFAGANSYTGNPMPVANTLTNSGTATAQLYELVWLPAATTVIISGTDTGKAVVFSGTTTSTSAALALGQILPAGVTCVLESPAGVYVSNNQTNFAFAIGTGATFTGLTISGANVTFAQATAPYYQNENVTYPSYVGNPHTTPTWVDDATVHAYPITGFGNTTQDTTHTTQVQIRQINTGNGPDAGLETQQWANYFAVYQSNLNQTHQKNTKQQQC